LAPLRFNLPNLAGECGDPRVDSVRARRWVTMRLELIDPRGCEDRADVIRPIFTPLVRTRM
jgi:hypothetical protein